MYGHQYAHWNHRTQVKCDKINYARIQNLCFELSTTKERANIWFSGMSWLKVSSSRFQIFQNKVALKLSLFCINVRSTK